MYAKMSHINPRKRPQVAPRNFIQEIYDFINSLTNDTIILLHLFTFKTPTFSLCFNCTKAYSG